MRLDFLRLRFGLVSLLSVCLLACDSQPASVDCSASGDCAGHDAGRAKDAGSAGTTKRDAGLHQVVATGGSAADAGNKTNSTKSSGLPCDVQAVLSTACGNCHGASPAFGAPMALASAADFQAIATDGSKMYERAKARIDASDVRMRMPPVTAPALDDDQLAVLDAWLDSDAAPSTESCALAAGDASVPAADGGAAVSDLDCYRFLAHEDSDLKTPFKVGVAKDAYFNFVFAPPWKGTAYGVVIRPIIDNTKVIHHWLLYQDTSAGTAGGAKKGDGTHPGGQLLYGWAPGGEEMDFRETGVDVGLELPETTYTVEFHYNSQDASAADASGVEVCVARQKPANIAALSWLGYDQLLLPSTTWTGTCEPTSKEPIHILSVWPHMHLTGTHMKGTINRAGGTTEVLHDEPFDFNYQRLYKKNVTLMPGDTITTECTYSQAQSFGERTDQEMCYLFTMAYPKGALVDDGSWGKQTHGGSACLGQ